MKFWQLPDQQKSPVAMSTENEGLLLNADTVAPDYPYLDQSYPHDERLGTSKDEHQSCQRLPKSHNFSFLGPLYILTLHLLCVLLGVYFFWTRIHWDIAMLDYDNRYPDWVPISYELRHEDPLKTPENEFTGEPNSRNTKAWDDLITPTFFTVSKQEIQKTGESLNDSVRLADGGYIAGLSVYHNIHCLRRLRLFVHSDYYYENLTDVNMEYLRGHMSHCIESLRRSILCAADTNVYTFTWEGAEYVSPNVWRPAPKSNQNRKCVRWEAVENWAMERHVALNPVLLKANGEEEKILMI